MIRSVRVNAGSLLARSSMRGAVFVIAALLAPACGLDEELADEDVGSEELAVVQTCRSTNVGGSPYSGVVCGGSTIDNCSKGVLYDCRRAAGNNCTFRASCSIGCLTGPNSTPVSVNTPRPTANDAC